MARCSRSTCARWRPDVALRVLGLGMRLDGAWFCSDGCVEAEAADRLRNARTRETAPAHAPTPLGTVLIQQRGITSVQLKTALAEQRRSGLRLGDQLVNLGYTSRAGLLRGLAAQSRVPYLASIDRASVRSAPGSLSGDEVRALGIVPFREVGDSLLVACRAPLPHAALAALTMLTGRTVEPYLVADDELEGLQQAYGGGAASGVPTTTVRDISDGASRIAAAAAEAGDVTVKEAHVDPFTWVRIAADGRISTLLVPPFPEQIEEHDRWLAATTPH